MKIIIDKKWCKGCELCIKVCPKKVLSLSDKRSERGYLMPKVSDKDACIGCMMCEKICPDLCIDIEK